MVDRLGISRNAIGNELKAWEQAGLAKRFYRTSEDGNQHVDLSISPNLLTRPDLLPAKGDRPRKAPVLCQACGSLNLMKHTKTRMVCPDCGTVHAEQEHTISLNQQDDNEQAEADSPPVAPSVPSDEHIHPPLCTREVHTNEEKNCTREVQHAVSISDEPSSSAPMQNAAATHAAVLAHPLDDAVLPAQEPTSPAVGSDGETADTQHQEGATPPCGEEAALSAKLEAAAALLVEMAGPSPLHICMNRRDKHGYSLKYGPVFRPFRLEDARDHLAGRSTRGARLWRPDGMTRALCFDADTQDAWQGLLDATRLLRMAGYVLLVEDSPVGRGGHLWIIYTGLVDARCAHRQVCQLAPMLAQIKEYRPAKGNSVRLPGGRYVTPEMSEPCKLNDASGVRVAETGHEAAVALLTYQTPAEFVPDDPLDTEPDQTLPTQAGDPPTSLAPLPVEADDHPAVVQLIRWFNATHPLERILPRQGDYANLPDQHHPSISYYPPDSTHAYEYWYDHGGAHQHGDAFELFCLVSGQNKSEVLRDLRAEWIAHHRGSDDQEELSQPQTRMEADATRGAALSASQASALAVPLGPASLSAHDVRASGPYPPPARPSYCCSSLVWIWNEQAERYRCGSCKQ